MMRPICRRPPETDRALSIWAECGTSLRFSAPTTKRRGLARHFRWVLVLLVESVQS